MLLDSHAHLIADDDDLYPPAPLSGKVRDGDLAVRFTAETLLRLMDDHGIERMCAVQRAHIYGYDNRYVIDSAKCYPDRMRAVVAIDANHPNAVREIHRWVDQGAAGIRFAALNPQVTDTDWFASPAALEAWDAAEKAGLSICLHVFRPIREKMLADLLPLLDRFTGVNVIVDHVSNAVLESGPPTHGIDAPLLALTLKPNVFFKLTTINLRRIVEAGRPAAPVLEHLVAQVGADKIMWGSDIGQTKGSYAGMVELIRESAQSLSVASQAFVFGKTCEMIYGTQLAGRTLHAGANPRSIQ